MSENNGTVIEEKDSETLIEENTIVDSLTEQPKSDEESIAQPIYEQIEAQENSEKKKVSIKDILLFAQNNIFTAKVCSIILIALGGIITAICLAQMVFWGLTVKNTYLSYWEAIKTFDYINLGIMAFMLLFIVVLLTNVIKGVGSLIRKGHEPRFESVSTLFAFFLFSLFVTKIFDDTTLLISNFQFMPLLKIIAYLLLGYVVVRLFVKDFKLRICPIAFSCVAIGIAIIMFTQNVGNFATYTIDGAKGFDLSDLSIYKYLHSISDSLSDVESVNYEYLFYEYGEYISGTDFGESLLIIPLQFIQIFVANILPYAALSLLGYLLYGLVGRNYLQYYSLQSCQKVSITMLIGSFISLATTIGFYFICRSSGTELNVQINYKNVIITFLLCIVMIVVTSLPWKIYNIIYKHHYAMYQKKERGN